MSNPAEFLRLIGEHPDDTLEYGENHTFRRGNLILRQLDVIENLVGFIETLRTHEALTRHQIEYRFHADTVDPDILPTSISDYIMTDDLNHITVTVTHEDDTCTSFSVSVSAGDREVVISRDPSLDEDDSCDVVFVGKSDRQIEKVGKADINRVIVGLITGKPVDRDINMNDVRIYAPESLENLQQALERVAPHITEDASHTFNEDRSVSFRQERFNGGSSKLDEITLRYETGNPDRHIRCLIDLSSGLNMTFSTVEGEDGVKPFVPESDNVERLLEVTAELNKQTKLLTADNTESVQPSMLDEANVEGLRQTQVRAHRYGETPPLEETDEEDILQQELLPDDSTADDELR